MVGGRFRWWRASLGTMGKQLFEHVSLSVLIESWLEGRDERVEIEKVDVFFS
jgi:hypothetical protein